MGLKAPIIARAVYGDEDVVAKEVFQPNIQSSRGQFAASLRKKKNRLLRKNQHQEEAARLGIEVGELIHRQACEAQKVIAENKKGIGKFLQNARNRRDSGYYRW